MDDKTPGNADQPYQPDDTDMAIANITAHLAAQGAIIDALIALSPDPARLAAEIRARLERPNVIALFSTLPESVVDSVRQVIDAKIRGLRA